MSTQCVCRLCGAGLTETFVDLGMSPLCESYVAADALDQPEVFYPLNVRLCPSCLLVQLPAYVSGEDIFSDYAYFSSYSDSWVAHAKRFADSMVEQLALTAGTASSRRSRAMTGTSCNTSMPGVSPSSALSRRRTWPRLPSPGDSNGGRVSRINDWQKYRRALRAGRSGRCEQRLRPRPRHPGLRLRAAGTGEGHRTGHPGVPPPASPHAATSVRHHLSRTLLVPLPPDRQPDPRHGRAACGRRRGARALMAVLCVSMRARRTTRTSPPPA